MLWMKDGCDLLYKKMQRALPLPTFFLMGSGDTPAYIPYHIHFCAFGARLAPSLSQIQFLDHPLITICVWIHERFLPAQVINNYMQYFTIARWQHYNNKR